MFKMRNNDKAKIICIQKKMLIADNWVHTEFCFPRHGQLCDTDPPEIQSWDMISGNSREINQNRILILKNPLKLGYIQTKL